MSHHRRTPETPVTFLPISLTAVSNSVARRPVMKTYAPSPTNVFAVASPIPPLPPVMSESFLQACSRHFSFIFSRFASFHERAEQRATNFEFNLG
jgi:hypothetical protein